MRGGQLLVSFVAVDDKLKVTTGHLGQCDLNEHFGLTAKDITQATVFILHKLATTGLGMPVRDRPADEAVVIDHALIRHVREHTEGYGADGAADEQRAGAPRSNRLIVMRFSNWFLLAHGCVARVFVAGWVL